MKKNTAQVKKFILHSSGGFIIALIICLAAVQVQAQSSSTPSASPEFLAEEKAPASTDQQGTQQSMLTAIPPRTEVFSVKPGETVQTTIRVRNSSNVQQKVMTTAEDFYIDEDGKTPIPLPEKAAASIRWSLAQWITLAPNSTTLAAGETSQINVVIEVPENAHPGGHYAMILHTPSADSGSTALVESDSISAVQQRVGTLVYLIVEGDIQENAFIRNVKMPSWVEFGPTPVEFDIDNQSDIHITPVTSVSVQNMFGKTVETLEVQSQNIFPQTKRLFSSQIEKVWGLGPYTATITAGYGTHGKVVSATTVFWMIPYRILLAIGVVLLALLGIVTAIRRYILHKKDLQTQQISILEERIREIENKSHQTPMHEEE